MPDNKIHPLFRGFASPNYTPVPDELFDELLAVLSGSELKVLLYIIRRTFGFKRASDNISLSQMLTGIVTEDGRVLDRGAGIKDKKTLLDAINKLEGKAIIVTQRQQSAARGNEPTTYCLKFRDETPNGKFPPPLGGKSRQGVGGETQPSPRGGNPPIQETVVQETDFDHSNFERPRQSIENDEGGPEQHTQRLQARKARLDGVGEGTQQMVPLGEALRLRAAAVAAIGSATASPAYTDQLRQRSPIGFRGNLEDRERLSAYLQDFATELGDEAPLSSTITRTLSIFTAAGLAPDLWGDALYQARALTQEHTAQIRKTAKGRGSELRRKNKMPYFLATLEQLVGVRPKPILGDHLA